MTTAQYGQSGIIYGTGVPATVGPQGTRFVDTTLAGFWPEYVSNGSAWISMGIAGPTVVGSLPAASAATKGMRSTVTDSNAALTAGIGAIVAAGGANVVPVFNDGTNWRIG